MILETGIAYLCGSVPFGLLLSNYFGNGKLRSSGSGNIGATNVVRTQGKVLGGLTFLLDGLKGIIPLLIFKNESPVVLFAAAVLGHMFSVWLKFKGGKGISTFFGGLLAISPLTSIISMLVWLSVFLMTKISSLSGLIAIFVGSLIFAYNNHEYYNIYEWTVFSIVPICIFIKHHDNILRLIKGEENRIAKE